MKLKKGFVKLLKKGFKSIGYDLVRLKGGLGLGTPENELIKIIKPLDIDLMLDIGGNKGQFATSIYKFGYTGKTLSFEPMTRYHDMLLENSKSNNQWFIYERCCVGDEEKEVEINISAMPGNSSLLDIKSNKFSVPNSHYVDKEKVNQITLASLKSNELIQNAKNIFVKMDVQGFEHYILNGLSDVDFKIVGFYLELSLENLYEDQEDYLFICNQLKDHGYDLVHINPEYFKSNRLVQFNGIFLHKSVSFT